MTAADQIHGVVVKNRTRAKIHGKGRVEAIDATDPELILYKVNGRWMRSLRAAAVGELGPYIDQGDPIFMGPFAGQ